MRRILVVITFIACFASIGHAQSNIAKEWAYESIILKLSSDNAFLNMAAESVAEGIESLLVSELATHGVESGKTTISFTEDGKFTAKVGEKIGKGTYSTSDSILSFSIGKLSSVATTSKKDGDYLSIYLKNEQVTNFISMIGDSEKYSAITYITPALETFDDMEIGVKLKLK